MAENMGYKKADLSAVVLREVVWCAKLESKQDESVIWMGYRNSFHMWFRKNRTVGAQWKIWGSWGRNSKQNFWEEKREKIIFNWASFLWESHAVSSDSCFKGLIVQFQEYMLEQNSINQLLSWMMRRLKHMLILPYSSTLTSQLPWKPFQNQIPLIDFGSYCLPPNPPPITHPCCEDACSKSKWCQKPRWVHLPLTFDSEYEGMSSEVRICGTHAGVPIPWPR